MNYLFACLFLLLRLVTARTIVKLPISPKLTLQGLQVEAQNGGSIQSFMGIPYAKPPLGERRWRKAEGLALEEVATMSSTSSTVFDATRMGSACIQQSGIIKILDMSDSDTSEDCLTINVYTPATANSTQSSSLPVMVWIYGGSFASGSASESRYDGNNILDLSPDFVFVSFNYRVGVMGFLVSQQMADEESLNLGLLDQKLALEWVQQNIHFFGGDPNRVTAAGESAGSLSISHHMLIPDQKLFQRALLLSGPASIHLRLPAEGQAGFDNITSAVGCQSNSSSKSTLDCLRKKDALKLRDAGDSIAYRIALDKNYINTQSLTILMENKQFSKIPLLLHLNQDEGSIFGLSIKEKSQLLPFVKKEKPYLPPEVLDKTTSTYLASNNDSASLSSAKFFAENSFVCMAKLQAKVYSEAGQKVYFARNTHINKITSLVNFFKPDIGVYHSSELAHLFQQRSLVSYVFEKDFSLNLHKRYLDFVRSGDPGWPDYASAMGKKKNFNLETNGMELDDDDIVGERCKLLLSTTYDVVRAESGVRNSLTSKALESDVGASILHGSKNNHASSYNPATSILLAIVVIYM